MDSFVQFDLPNNDVSSSSSLLLAGGTAVAMDDDGTADDKEAYGGMFSTSRSSSSSSSTLGSQQLSLPGDTISLEPGCLRGHGSYVVVPSHIRSSVAGPVQKVSKLVTVLPVKERYPGEARDVVVGRITEVGQTRWRVDINSRQDAVLQLSSINLPGGAQRRKTAGDELDMRKFFQENDVISAEVHSFYQDGSMALHSRSLKYGKLQNGTFVAVPHVLIKRQKSHFITLPSLGVDLVLGRNGYIWVSAAAAASASVAANSDSGGGVAAAAADAVPSEAKSAASDQLSQLVNEKRELVARVVQVIRALATLFLQISLESISSSLTVTSNFPTSSLLNPDVLETLKLSLLGKHI